ncbi:HAD-like protein [Macroventuria anomochaeta]|uniref:HAD-like protein n=1 Tax=Macroventuria anomochaeta TaxID=301207 RepID=A0ACB6RQV1_9PLEO|nr:HAD-like protein [Macroventuria anomochaeta]KAF2624092.1 HAD-like protein [Macroventuria anomochaeta]
MPKTDHPLTDLDCLSFDCYGTLVDWEGGIYQALAPLYTQLPDDHPIRHDRLSLLRAFIKNEGIIESANPTILYKEVLAQTYGRLAEELGVAAPRTNKAKFGSGVGDWPIYPDTADALKRLQEHFKLDIGSYKPDARNFDYLITHCEEDLGVERRKIIHVAQALYHDHVPATAAGLANAWIERGEDMPSAIGGKPEDLEHRIFFLWRFKNMGEMADTFQVLYDKVKPQ